MIRELVGYPDIGGSNYPHALGNNGNYYVLLEIAELGFTSLWSFGVRPDPAIREITKGTETHSSGLHRAGA